MSVTTTETVPSIYVACLSSYNNGVLHGVHIDLEDGIEEDEVWDQVKAMLAKSKYPPAEEWAIHDHEGFEGIRVWEYDRFERVLVWAEGIRKHGAPYAAWVNDVLGRDYGSSGEDYSVDKFQDAFLGEYDSLADYAQESFESNFGSDFFEKLGIEQIGYNIDWEGYGEAEFNDLTVVESGSKVLIFDPNR